MSGALEAKGQERLALCHRGGARREAGLLGVGRTPKKLSPCAHPLCSLLSLPPVLTCCAPRRCVASPVAGPLLEG